MIACTPRTGPLRCALCHDALGGAATLSCRACGAAHHPACSRIPARCATCSARLVVRWRPPRAPGTRRVVAAAVTALALAGSALGAAERACARAVTSVDLRPATAVALRPGVVRRHVTPLCVECDWLLGADSCEGLCRDLTFEESGPWRSRRCGRWPSTSPADDATSCARQLLFEPEGTHSRDRE